MKLKVQLITESGNLINEELFELDSNLQATFDTPLIITENKESRVLLYGYKIVPNISIRDKRTGHLF